MNTHHTYISPVCSLLEISPGAVLMASGGGGRSVTSNIGLGYSVENLDPREAW